MKIRGFNKIIRGCSTKGFLDILKINKLTDEIKSKLVYFIVRNRGPIIQEFIPANFDKSWLESMGYLYLTKGQRYTFIHTCEHSIV